MGTLRISLALILTSFVWASVGFAVEDQPLWTKGRPTPVDGLNNPFNFAPITLERYAYEGKIHALSYPVSVTGILLPYYPVKKILESDTDSPIRKIIYKFIKGAANVRSFDDMNRWLGLHEFPKEEGKGPYEVPRLDPILEERMGFTLMQRDGALGFTHSCATCHSHNLFGQKIIGLTNRFPRANHYFVKGKTAFHAINNVTFSMVTNPTKAELKMLSETKESLRSVDATTPAALGLDTSLAHVAISLSLRLKDEYATKNFFQAHFPRKEPLRDFVADTKPGVWWNVKYKNRWLLDGSVVSGNPIFTNLLWNEIGRGTDLQKLEVWLDNNTEVVKELTTAVFNSEAPRMTDFFDDSRFDINRAIRGQKIFEANQCTKCHGNYKKAWELPKDEFLKLSFKDRLNTIEVQYPEQTLVKNVGTDPNRWMAMKSLKQLNDLAISKKHGIVIELQEGYVPPPLVGIWARWPYLHNNSIPNLCALMTPPELRPKSYYSGEANNPETDFDFECNGYPLGDATPKAWKTRAHLYQTGKPGMTNVGHYNRIFRDEDGNEKLTRQDKLDLIHFLQTL